MTSSAISTIRSDWRRIRSPKPTRAGTLGQEGARREDAIVLIRGAVLEIAKRFRRADAEHSPEHAERRYQAIARCDLGGEPAKRVAADLGISIRQLRRERSYAHARIERSLRGDPTGSRIETFPDAADLELSLARRLSESGRADSATTILEALAVSGAPSNRRVEALAALAEIFLDRDEPAAAAEALARARLISAASRDETSSSGARAKLALSSAQLDRRRGDLAGALLREDAVLSSFDSDIDQDGSARPVVTAILVDRAWRAAGRGAWETALAYVHRACELLVQCHGSAPIAEIDALVVESHLFLSRSGDLRQAETAARRSLELAQRGSFGRRAAVAGMQLADILYRRGLRDEATAIARASVEVAQNVGSRAILAGATLGAADLELMSRHADAAVPYLESAASLVADGSSYWARLQLAWANVCIMRGVPDAALQHAVAGRDAAEALGNHRLRGAALRRCGLIEHILREPTASRTIERALDALRQYGTRYALALGYEASYRVTGSAAHLQYARDLLAPQIAG